MPKLRYVLRFLSAQGNELVFDGDIAPDGWAVQCGDRPITAKASSSGHLQFKVANGDSVSLTGTLMFSSDIPQCSPQNCGTTYRDVYTFEDSRYAPIN